MNELTVKGIQKMNFSLLTHAMDRLHERFGVIHDKKIQEQYMNGAVRKSELILEKREGERHLLHAPDHEMTMVFEIKGRSVVIVTVYPIRKNKVVNLELSESDAYELEEVEELHEEGDPMERKYVMLYENEVRLIRERLKKDMQLHLNRVQIESVEKLVPLYHEEWKQRLKCAKATKESTFFRYKEKLEEISNEIKGITKDTKRLVADIEEQAVEIGVELDTKEYAKWLDDEFERLRL